MILYIKNRKNPCTGICTQTGASNSEYPSSILTTQFATNIAAMMKSVGKIRINMRSSSSNFGIFIVNLAFPSEI
jgi:hypothetical protein